MNGGPVSKDEPSSFKFFGSKVNSKFWMLNLKIKVCCLSQANLNLQNIEKHVIRLLMPNRCGQAFLSPPPVQERVKYLLCSTFGNRYVSCLDTISKMGFTICSFILLNPVEAYSCLQVRFINFVKVLTILINA